MGFQTRRIEANGIAYHLIDEGGQGPAVLLLLRELLHGNGDVEEYIADLSRPGALTAGLSWYRASLPLAQFRAPPRALPAVKASTLGVWSSGDDYLSEEPMLRSANLVTGGWRYERFEDASHWIPLDQPDRLNKLLVEFLS